MGITCELYALPPAQCDRILTDPVWAAALFRGEYTPPRSLKLEKSWHGLHFLLTGTCWEGDPPLDFLLHGGQSIYAGMGEDAPRLFRPVEVQMLDKVLAGISNATFWSRFDRARMRKLNIYPVQDWDEPEADLREHYVASFRALKRLIHDASASGMGLLVSVGDGGQEYATSTDEILHGPSGPTIRRWARRVFGSVIGVMGLLVFGVCWWRYRRMDGRPTNLE